MEEKETTKENTENLQGVGPEEVTENSDAKAKTETEDSGTEQEEKTEDSDSKSEEESEKESEETDGKKHKKERKKKSTIHRIINVVEWLLLLASVTLLAYIFITTMQGKAADFFGYRILHVVTGSMEPTISVDDYIVVQDVNPEDLE